MLSQVLILNCNCIITPLLCPFNCEPLSLSLHSKQLTQCFTQSRYAIHFCSYSIQSEFLNFWSFPSLPEISKCSPMGIGIKPWITRSNHQDPAPAYPLTLCSMNFHIAHHDQSYWPSSSLSHLVHLFPSWAIALLVPFAQQLPHYIHSSAPAPRIFSRCDHFNSFTHYSLISKKNKLSVEIACGWVIYKLSHALQPLSAKSP